MTLAKEKDCSIGALVLDAVSFISLSSSLIMNRASSFYTVPNVINEIKDKKSLQELSLWENKITVRTPQLSSIQKIILFSKKTGDYEVLSITDIHILALTYELDCEANGDSWKLPKELNKPKVNNSSHSEHDNIPKSEDVETQEVSRNQESLKEKFQENLKNEIDQITENTKNISLKEMDNDDNDGWITPSNIHRYKSIDEKTTMISAKTKTLKVACVTNDFAMQNVLLQMDLNLVSLETGLKIKTIKSWVLRCYGCFKIIKDTSKKFCPGCGGNTLLRTSCSTDSNGKFRIYLKRHMQWNNRGTIYPIPKPRHGSASGKGHKQLIFREDQKEYQKAIKYQKRKKEKDLFDPDSLPDILTGKRNSSHYNVVIGMGKRNPNEKTRSRQN
ncbi:hypothetical protein PORY_001119 [Pneumocystis oryctolagi]|uniref:Uncharacterized protein n=1 Tax=Pneumocystis oryctolagi TaxID=42067 RepID=A0ACB7CDA5_9ASCO|nr:hypothetical protein PORY_001119 [Pneumocystis oryctolagi]